MNATVPSDQQRGFTLVELMIVVVIVGVLAAIGVPAYTNYVGAAKRADANQALNHMAQLQERYFTDNNKYAVTPTDLGYASPAVSKEGYWALSITGDGTIYTLQAAPTGGHSDADCATITLDSTGLRASTPAGKNCWSGK